MTLLMDAGIVKQQEVAEGYFRLTVFAPAVAVAAKPGQFLHMRCGDTLDPLLRRPISIHAVNRDKGEVALLYKVVGKGTALLAQKGKGDQVNLLGPLGKGFTLPERNEKVCVVAGGIGIAPLFCLLQELTARNHSAAVFLGAATGSQLLCAGEMERCGHIVHIATDDGSAGFPGTVTGLFEKTITPGSSSVDRVYACGPRRMLKRLCEIIRLEGIPGEVSVEERMGCGVGACLSCACKTRGEGNGVAYKRVCMEGPVFPVGEVVWE